MAAFRPNCRWSVSRRTLHLGHLRADNGHSLQRNRPQQNPNCPQSPLPKRHYRNLGPNSAHRRGLGAPSPQSRPICANRVNAACVAPVPSACHTPAIRGEYVWNTHGIRLLAPKTTAGPKVNPAGGGWLALAGQVKPAPLPNTQSPYPPPAKAKGPKVSLGAFLT